MNKKITLLIQNLLMIVSGLISAFFIFYTTRLLYVTKGLTVIRVGGGGTYIGAIAFPLIALLFGYISWRFLKVARRNKNQS